MGIVAVLNQYLYCRYGTGLDTFLYCVKPYLRNVVKISSQSHRLLQTSYAWPSHRPPESDLAFIDNRIGKKQDNTPTQAVVSLCIHLSLSSQRIIQSNMSPPECKEVATATAASSSSSSSSTNTTEPSPSSSRLQECMLSQEEAAAAIQSFTEFLQFETVSSVAAESGAYVKCAAWLVQQLKDAGIFSNIFYLPEAPAHSPVVMAVMKGRDESLPVLLLNSHYDVVPAAESDWTVPPFAGLLSEDGSKLYGRGTQDMKCVCVQYIAALSKICRVDPTWQPERSIYLSFVPDEEVGGGGMAAFLESATYKDLPGIALALDEGLASVSDTFAVFYGERLPWWVNVTASGPTGHGSRFIDNTAVEQLVDLANKALAFREGQRAQLGLSQHENCAHAVAAANSNSNKNNSKNTSDSDGNKTNTLGDVTSLNITSLQAGVKIGSTYAYNCVPPTAQCSLDIRISPHTDPAEIGAMLDQWCQECSKDADGGSHVTWNYIGGQGNSSATHATTSTNVEQNPWYAVFSNAMTEMKCQMEPQVFPAATDSRFLRALGIRALGFSPMRNTEIMLHENDEYIPVSTFLEGIGVYVGLLKALGSQGKELEGALE
jgi:aminoacylase